VTKFVSKNVLVFDELAGVVVRATKVCPICKGDAGECDGGCDTELAFWSMEL